MIKLDHTFEAFPVFEYDKGYHFNIGHDILYPLFHAGLSSSLFVPDPHVKLPHFHDESLSTFVNTLAPTIPIATTPTTSSISLNRLDVVQSHYHDIIYLNQHQVHSVTDALKELDNTIYDDLKSLSHDIHDLGAGSVPDSEIPVRVSLTSISSTPITISSPSSSTSTSFDLHSTTPVTIKQKYSSKLNTLLVYLCANEAITGFCTLPGSKVELIIDESKKHLLFRRQFPIPQTLWSLADQVIKRWFDTGKTLLAPVGCEFNLPLTIAPKKDENGKLTGIRVCLDTRILNAILLSR